MTLSARADGDREFIMRDSEFRMIADAIYDHAGIVLGDHKKELVYSRLARRLRRLGLSDFGAYIERLNGPDADTERGNLINALTTNHTHFFREDHHFNHLRDVCVPAWKRRAERDGDRTLRLWSAGCSTGEEPYSMAMTMADALQSSPGWNWKLLATDIDTQVLSVCKAGEYERRSGSQIPPRIRARYCQLLPGRERFAVSEEIRRHIVFNRLNLLRTWPMKKQFDAVFCRNVTIYFDRETKTQLIARYRQIIKPGGWLFLGHSETVLDRDSDFEPVGRTIYRVPGGEDA